MTSSSPPVVAVEATDYNDGENSNDDEVPTIELTSEAEIEVSARSVGAGALSSEGRVVPVVDVHHHGTTMTPSLGEGRRVVVSEAALTAEQVASARDVEMGFESIRRSLFSDRAEFISATFYKRNSWTPLGLDIGLHHASGEIRIFSTTHTKGGLAQDSPLKKGDVILSVNNKRATKEGGQSDLTAIANILRHSVGNVTVVVHNQGGQSGLVESMVMKSSLREVAGISVVQRSNGEVRVKSIHPAKQFSHSLLNPEDLILSINGQSCSTMTASQVAEIIQSTSQVTIVAKTLRTTGVVLAEVSTRSGGGVGALPGSSIAASSSSPDGRASHGVSTAAASQPVAASRGSSTPQCRPSLVIFVSFVAAAIFVAFMVINVDNEDEQSTTTSCWYCDNYDNYEGGNDQNDGIGNNIWWWLTDSPTVAPSLEPFDPNQ
jgi:hypothetical protein